MDTKILTKILNKEKDIPIYVMAQQSFTGEYDYVLSFGRGQIYGV